MPRCARPFPLLSTARHWAGARCRRHALSIALEQAVQQAATFRAVRLLSLLATTAGHFGMLEGTFLPGQRRLILGRIEAMTLPECAYLEVGGDHSRADYIRPPTVTR